MPWLNASHISLQGKLWEGKLKVSLFYFFVSLLWVRVFKLSRLSLLCLLKYSCVILLLNSLWGNGNDEKASCNKLKGITLGAFFPLSCSGFFFLSAEVCFQTVSLKTTYHHCLHSSLFFVGKEMFLNTALRFSYLICISVTTVFCLKLSDLDKQN